METKKTSFSFKCMVWLLKVFYIRFTPVGTENLPDEPCIIAANHAQMNGPIASEIYFPVPNYTWCNGEMMYREEVPAYAFQDFWSGKPKWTHWFFRLLSHAIAPLAVILFNNARTIEVRRDLRIMSTLRSTVERMQQGYSVVIFPECYDEHNHIVHKFQEGFVDAARIYHRKTGIEPCFVPMYVAPRLKKMYFGKPIRFCAANPADQERRRICDYLMDEITNIACSLPRHKVVPYPNISKKDYPTNIPSEVK